MRARACATASTKPAIAGTSVLNLSASASLVGTRPPSFARCIWFSSVFMHLTNSAALLIFALLPVCGTVHASPPSGAVEVWPALLIGNETTPKLTFAFSRLEICHGPLSIIAALPAMNWSLTSPWLQVTTLLDDTPLSTRSFHSASASATCGSLSLVSSPPLVHIGGRNCHAPSKSAVALNAKPYWSPTVSFFAVDFSSSQVVGGVTPAFASTSLL